MFLRARVPVALLALALSLGGIVWFSLLVLRSDSEPQPAAEASTPSLVESRGDRALSSEMVERRELTPPTPPVVPGSFYALEPGSSFTLEFDASHSTRMRQGQPAQEVGVAIDLAGRLQALVVADTDEASVLQLQTEASELAIELAGTTASGDALEKARASLATAALVRIDGDGRTLGWRFDDAVPGETRNLLRTLWSSLLPVVPSLEEERWETEEADASGPCRMAYCRLETEGGAAISLRREKLSAPAPNEGAVLDVNGEGISKVDPKLRFPTQVDWSESRFLEMSDAALEVEAEARASFELLAHERVPVSELPRIDLEGPWDAASGANEKTVSRARRPAAPAALMALDFDQLSALIQRLMAGGQRASRELYDAQRALAAMIVDDPASLEKLRRLLDSGSVDDDAAMVMLAAAGMAQTSPAQSFLAEILGEEQRNESQRVSAAWSTMQLDAPEAPVVAALQANYRDPDAPVPARNASMLALGAMQHKLGDDESGAGPVDSLLAAGPASDEPQDVVNWLLALGNSGAPRIVPAVRTRLQHPVDEVRVAAIEALRLVPVRATFSMLRAALGDTDFRVRSKAIDQLGPLAHAEIDEVLFGLLETEGNSMVRARIVESLKGRGGDDARARRMLRYAAENDEEESLRERASQLLAAG